MCGFLLVVILYREHGRRPGLFETPLRIEWTRMRRLVGLGLPAATQVTLEVGVFAAATALAGRLPPAALAAHQIAINFASFTFMVPLGIASAGAVRVGQAVGRRDAAGAGRAGWTALLFGDDLHDLRRGGVPVDPSRADRRVHAETRRCCRPARRCSSSPPSFSCSTVSRGSRPACCGASATRARPCSGTSPPTGSSAFRSGTSLCFIVGLGVIGLWWGLSVGLIICGVALLAVWSRRIHRLAV